MRKYFCWLLGHKRVFFTKKDNWANYECIKCGNIQRVHLKDPEWFSKTLVLIEELIDKRKLRR